MSNSLGSHGLYVAHGVPLSMDFLGKNSGVGCHFLQRIFPTQGSNLYLLHMFPALQADSLPLGHQGSLQRYGLRNINNKRLYQSVSLEQSDTQLLFCILRARKYSRGVKIQHWTPTKQINVQERQTSSLLSTWGPQRKEEMMHINS